jgi:hypothetical protein
LTISEVQVVDFSLNKNEINIAYFGKFYKNVREPREIISLFESIFEKNPLLREKIKIHIFGDIFENFVAELEKSYLVLHGLLPREKVNAAMQKFDFLLNISNQTDYQLPSKAPDYMNSGKPILNLYFVENDCFKAFFTDYPLILNVKNDDFDLKIFIDFLEKNKNETVDKEILEKIIKPYSIENIAKKYLDLLNQNE